MEGNYHEISETRGVSDFWNVQLFGSYQIYITQSENYSVSVSGEENLIPYIETRQEAGTLVIKQHDTRILHEHSPIIIRISAPNFEKIKLSGSGYINGEALKSSDLNLSISGSGKMRINSVCNTITASISGSGDYDLSGTTHYSDFDISGSGEIHSYNLLSDSCNAKISGSGDMYVDVEKYIYAKITGSGNIHYRGNPVINSNISGSGEIIHH